MSVIFWDVKELANVAIYLGRRSRHEGDFTGEYLKPLALYSQGNALAYERRYAEKAKAATLESLKREVNSITKLEAFDPARAKSTLRLLSYNGPEQSEFPGSHDYWEAVSTLMGAAFSVLMDEVER